MKPLIVYGWLGYRIDCPPALNGSRQTREIMAARSISEVNRATGLSRNYLSNYAGETGNANEIEVAMSEPGVVFWKPLDYRPEGGWTRAERTLE